ncbi:DinB family protein [Actinokineospora enzanensis]|uniref:DinB family protein n=1 Tax=Actinokineospora enzanensis TaxID=155975 RepID=UPI00036B78B2|nr:DinB family protein [Actinokineospora enzanensis]
MSTTGTTPELDRSWPANDAADELRLQREFLAFLRVTAVNKAAGLTPAQAIETPLATSPLMSVLAVLKHLTAVERYWITRTAGGADEPLLWDPTDVHAEWRLAQFDTPSAVTAAYQREWELADRAIAGLTPDSPARADPKYTLRWILAHVVQETARHVGHLDILREYLDGHTGE